MTHKKLLLTGTLSILLLASSLSAQGSCVDGACFVNLKNLKPTKKFQEKKRQMIVLKKPRFASSKSEFKNDTSVEGKAKNKSFDIILNGKITVVFPSYVMTNDEKIAYYKEQKAMALNKKVNEKANIELQRIIQPIEKIEDRILNKHLPISEYFCDNDKKPVRIKNSNFYECV